MPPTIELCTGHFQITDEAAWSSAPVALCGGDIYLDGEPLADIIATWPILGDEPARILLTAYAIREGIPQPVLRIALHADRGAATLRPVDGIAVPWGDDLTIPAARIDDYGRARQLLELAPQIACSLPALREYLGLREAG